MVPDELEYLLRLYRLDEVSKKLILNDCVTNDTDLRSPSPPPSRRAAEDCRNNSASSPRSWSRT